ncbi:MAG TPA: hypothetical protein P5081_17040 [Phycisphaerae bacterium]|nr:hypothetical protein [Phycisphaerae bacterium]HRW54579.1 hypothetical protein [Phycisphaerae bacterium]
MLRFRWFKLTFGSVLLLALVFVATDQLSAIKIRRLEAKIGDLEREMAELKLYAERIQASHRVAQVNVVESRVGPANMPVTVLRWQQIGRGGELGPPETLEVLGEQVYFEALVLKFDFDLIGGAAENRETNLALFRRAFGDYQAPRTGVKLDQSAPSFATATESELALHKTIWDRFLAFTEDEALAKEYGVRVAQYEAPSVNMKPGQVWEVSIDAAGGLNLKMLANEQSASPAHERQISMAATR